MFVACIDMRLLIVVLIFNSVEIRGDCLQVDQCVRNITETFLAFGDYYSHIMFRARDYIKGLIPKFKMSYREMNITVLSGPETCRDQYLLTKKMGYYFKDSMNMCLVPEPDPNPEDVKNIKNFNARLLATDDSSDRVRYCSHLVPYFNIYCRYLDDVMTTADNCDVLKNFDLLFKSKWIQCSSNANSTAPRSKLKLLTSLTRKIASAIPKPKLTKTDELTTTTSSVPESINLTTTTPGSKLKLLPGLSRLTKKLTPTTSKPSETTTTSTKSVPSTTGIGLLGASDKLI